MTGHFVVIRHIFRDISYEYLKDESEDEMHKEAREELRVRLKLVVLELADQFGVTKACREFHVPRSSFYRWKQKYEKDPSLPRRL